MDFIIAEPEPSYSHVTWFNIATALGCFCVQQRTDQGVAKSTSLFNRYVRSVYDQSLYRVIHTLNPIDFVDEATRVREKSKLDDKSQRFVLAAAEQLGDIMEAYSLILNAWRVHFVDSKPSGGRPHGDHADATTEERTSIYLPFSLRPGAHARREKAARFSTQRWSTVFAFLEKRGGSSLLLQENADAAEEEEDEEEQEQEEGKRWTNEQEEERGQQQPSGSQRASSTRRRSSSVNNAARQASASGSSGLHTLGPPKPPRRFPAAALKIIREGHAGALSPLSSPQLVPPGFRSSGDVTPASSSSSSSSSNHHSRSGSSVTETPLLASAAVSQSESEKQLASRASTPATSGVVRRRGGGRATSIGGSTAGSTPLLRSVGGSRSVTPGAVTPVPAKQSLGVAEDCLSSTAGESSSTTAKDKTAKKTKTSGFPLSFQVSRLLPHVSLPTFSSVKNSVKQFSVQRCYTATRRKCHALLGVFNIRTSHPLDKAIVMVAGLVFLAANTYFIGHVVLSGRRGVTTRMMLLSTVLIVLSSLVLFFYLKTTESSGPKGAIAGYTLYGQRQRGLRPRRRKIDPPLLSSKEQILLMQLQNYGAPYSAVVLRPLRGWNQTPGSSGWSKAWKFRDLWFSERQSPFSPTVLEVRASINIKKATIGTLQSLILSAFYAEVDDEDEDEESHQGEPAAQPSEGPGESSSRHSRRSVRVHSPSFLYPRRTELDIVKQLEYNLFVVRGLEHSRVLGVPPYEAYSYVSPAVLLDEDQQKELRIRHPFKDEHGRPPPPSPDGEEGSHTTGAASSAGYAYMVSFVHCPADAVELTMSNGGSIQSSSRSGGANSAMGAVQRGTLHHQMWIGFDEPDGSLTLCVYKSLSLPALDQDKYAVYRHTVYRGVLHVVFRLVKALQSRGPMPNELTAYRNNSRYYPFLHSTEGPRSASHLKDAFGNETTAAKGRRGGKSDVRSSRTPQPPPGIHWSAETTLQTLQLSALEPLSGLAGKPYGESGRHRADPPKSPFPERSHPVVLPSALVRFLQHLATSEREKSWEVLSDQSQNGLKIFYAPKPDAKGFRQLKTEVYFPFQGLDAIEMSLLSSFIFPTFGFEVSRREPMWMREKPKRPEVIGLVPVETIFKVRGAERVVSPRSVTMELVEGVHFTAGQLLDMLPSDVVQDLAFLQNLSRDTCMFFYGGETSNHEELQQYLSPLDRPLCVEVPSYGFLCWKSQFATEMVASSSPAGMASPTAFPSVVLNNDNPESTAGGVRVIAFVKHGSVRPFQWSSAWSFRKKQVHQIDTMIQSIKDMCQQYVSHWVDDLDR